jgi:23S rRNA pseudouridine1911/1915/1917 synthase
MSKSPGAQPFTVLYEDNHLIAVSKKAGILVQGDQTGDVPLLDLVKEYIREKYDKPGEAFLGTVHRLDRPVSGLVLFARTSKALERMTEVFRTRNVQKAYRAAIGKKPPQDQGTLKSWLVKNEATNTVRAYGKEVSGSQYAELDYTLIGRFGNIYLLEVNPLTGRPHQIRVQLAGMGCPIVGDLKYGYPKANSDGSILLHSFGLSFIHPVRKEPIAIEAPLPRTGEWELLS